MRLFLFIFTIYISSSFLSFAQDGRTCWREVSMYERIRVPCSDTKTNVIRPDWTYSWDMDSLCYNMEVKLINKINQHRISLGLNIWEYSESLYNGITLPHNLYQVANRYVGHSENGKNIDERCKEINWLGFKRIGENCASHHRFETNGVSFLFEQYMRSPKHKALIEDPNYRYYATSVIYNYEDNIFYNTLNTSYDF